MAKPIGRLGGPGLIPVSYVEIRDTLTGQPVPDAQEAVARAGVPKVEEWKKMTKYYRDRSIPLGKIESGMNLNNGRGSVSSSLVGPRLETNSGLYRVNYLLRYQPRYRGGALIMTSIGSSSKSLWRMVGIGSSLDITRTSMTFRLPYCGSLSLRLVPKVERGQFLSCQDL